MSLEHSQISDPYIHEPKGASSASANTVYVADGSGSGAWSSYFHSGVYQINADVHSSGTTYIVAATAGTITDIYITLGVAASSSSTAVKLSIAGVDITGASQTIASSATLGQVYHLTPTANNSFTAGQVITYNSAGGSGGSLLTSVSILYNRTS